MTPVHGHKFDIKFKMADFLLGLAHCAKSWDVICAWQISYISLKRTVRATSNKYSRWCPQAILPHPQAISEITFRHF